MTYELHPLCTLFPRLTGNEFDLLKNDILQNGLREPIILHEGMILDGGNRYRACLDVGVTPEFIHFEGGNIVNYVISANLHRRHLTPGQQAAIVASAQNWTEAQPASRPEKAGHVTGLSTVADRMAQSGVSDKTQRRADKVAKADPELAKKVGRGEVTLPKALKQISPEKEPQEKYDPKETELQEAHDTINSLSEENDTLRDAIACGQLPSQEIMEAGQIIEWLRAQVKTLELELDAVKKSRNIYQRENEELKRQCYAQRNQLKKMKA